MFVQLVVLSTVLAGASFGFGMLPLAVAFSKTHIESLSALGTGLLLGAGLGVIIPEGIENLIESKPNAVGAETEVPTGQIALSLLVGFVLMLALEQLAIPNSHHLETYNPPTPYKAVQTGPSSNAARDALEFDAELDDLERSGGNHSNSIAIPATPISLEVGSGATASAGRQKAFALTVGLVIHSLADGLALGVSALAKTAPGTTNSVSLVVFLALLLHKAPTSLALTTSLLAHNLPKPECRTYLAAFSAATPLSAILSYTVLALFGNSESGGWTGIALLVSGGSFLYVATVLQPVSQSGSGHAHAPAARVVLVIVGMLIPFTLSSVLGHGH